MLWILNSLFYGIAFGHILMAYWLFAEYPELMKAAVVIIAALGFVICLIRPIID